jgi:hypothetical protein
MFKSEKMDLKFLAQKDMRPFSCLSVQRPNRMDVVINSVCNSIPEGAQQLVSQGSALLNFLVSLGYNLADPPMADLLSRTNNLEGKWLIVSPIQWHATHNDAMIVAMGKELQLGEIESRHWFQQYSNYLAEEHITLYYHDPEIWLLRSDNMPPLNAKPAHQLLNYSLMPELVQLDSTMYWQKFFTESQMFFASFGNKAPLNGVWLWGGAEIATKKSIAVCADEQFMSIAQTCSSNVTLYNPSVSLKEFQILLFENINGLSKAHHEQLKKIPACWYWINTAYTRGGFKWFTRLWRKLTYAH